MRRRNYSVILESWIYQLISVESIKHAFEYATITRNTTLLKNLLELHKTAEGTVGECVQVYSILYNYLIDNLNGKNLELEVIKLENIKNKSLQILLEIIKLYGYYHNGKYMKMLDQAKSIQKKVNSLGDKKNLFIKECYTVRISEVLVPAYFHLNKIEKMRYYAEQLICTEICAKIASDGYYYLGMSYITEDAELAIKQLRKSYELLENHQHSLRRQALSNLNFALSFLSLPLHDESNEQDEYIKIFNKFKTGKKLEWSDYQKFNKEKLSTYKKYYKAVIENDLGNLCSVASEFFKSKNFFFASLVAQEIKKLDSGVLLVDLFINFSYDEEEDKEFEKDNISCFADIRNLRIASF